MTVSNVVKLFPEVSVRKNGRFADSPASSGDFVKKAGPLHVYKRTRGGKDFYDFVETPEKGKLTKLEEPVVYTYSLEKGNLTYGSGSLWARQELLTASPAAQAAGKKPAVPRDMEHALGIALEHYNNYKPGNRRSHC